MLFLTCSMYSWCFLISCFIMCLCKLRCWAFIIWFYSCAVSYLCTYTLQKFSKPQNFIITVETATKFVVFEIIISLSSYKILNLSNFLKYLRSCYLCTLLGLCHMSGFETYRTWIYFRLNAKTYRLRGEPNILQSGEDIFCKFCLNFIRVTF